MNDLGNWRIFLAYTEAYKFAFANTQAGKCKLMILIENHDIFIT